MPFRNSHWWLLGLLAVTILGFWQSFFGQIGTENSRTGLLGHIHAWTAMCWMLLLIIQCWAINTKRHELHRIAGKASLAIFPVLIAGLVAILDQAASTFVQFGPNRLSHAIFYQTGIPLFAYLYFYYAALKLRNNVWQHSANMLAMPFLLWESPFSRLLKENVPIFMTAGFDIDSIVAAVQTGMIVAAILALIVWCFDRDRRRPILAVAVLSLMQAALVQFAFAQDQVFAVMEFLAKIPSWQNLLAGFLAGSIISWLGWKNAAPVSRGGASSPNY